MEYGGIFGNIDVAQLVLYAFWIFFAGLIWYLRQEDRREGYPLEDDLRGKYNRNPWLFIPGPKTFHLPHGQGTVSVPNAKRDIRPIAARRIANFSGAPLMPTGNPMKDGVGPAAWAERADVVDRMAHGEAKIVPLRSAAEFTIAEGDPNPIGMRVAGCNGKLAGTVADVWIDRSESLIRYLEVDLGLKDARNVLVPINFCVLKQLGQPTFYVEAITAEQFADIPVTAKKTQITLLEEERIVAYVGGGLLYATPQRQEAFL